MAHSTQRLRFGGSLADIVCSTNSLTYILTYMQADNTSVMHCSIVQVRHSFQNPLKVLYSVLVTYLSYDVCIMTSRR